MASENTSIPQYRVLKVGSVPSLSGKSHLGYQIACTPESDVLVRLVSNTGTGFYSQDWFRFAQILDLLPPSAPLTFWSLQPLVEGRSINTAGFLLAVLKGLGVVKPKEDNPRCQELSDVHSFAAEVQALMDSPVSLGDDARLDGGKGKRKTIKLSKAKKSQLD